MDCAAEQLFNDITDKNGQTYEALIEGLVKVSESVSIAVFVYFSATHFVQHKYHKRAFQMFEEMRANGYQGERNYKV